MQVTVASSVLLIRNPMRRSSGLAEVSIFEADIFPLLTLELAGLGRRTGLSTTK